MNIHFFCISFMNYYWVFEAFLMYHVKYKFAILDIVNLLDILWILMKSGLYILSFVICFQFVNVIASCTHYQAFLISVASSDDHFNSRH